MALQADASVRTAALGLELCDKEMKTVLDKLRGGDLRSIGQANEVVADIKEFAKHRSGDESPYGWRKYVVSQQDFMCYCCYATIRALLNETDESTLVENARER